MLSPEPGPSRAGGSGQVTGQEIEPFPPPAPLFPTEPHPDAHVRGSPHLQAPQH